MINTIDTFHKTKLGYVAFLALELGLTYGFASLSIDRGNILYYLLTLLFLIGALQNVFMLARTYRAK